MVGGELLGGGDDTGDDDGGGRDDDDATADSTRPASDTMASTAGARRSTTRGHMTSNSPALISWTSSCWASADTVEAGPGIDTACLDVRAEDEDDEGEDEDEDEADGECRDGVNGAAAWTVLS